MIDIDLTSKTMPISRGEKMLQPKKSDELEKFLKENIDSNNISNFKFNQWTTEKPNKPGYYWAYENLDECDADIFIVKFTEYGLKHKICSICGDPQFFHFDHFSHFVGPLEMPERPKNNKEQRA